MHVSDDMASGGEEAHLLACRLLAFYDREGRVLPWRGERDLYRLWVSEIMLQQTGVTTVLAYYPRFLERFPDVQSLAQATEEEVLILWQGLGYYQRARHLHQAARQVVTGPAGRLPEDEQGWLALPGIGASTAAAILAIGRDQPLAILDGNVKRVLARLLALPEPLSSRIAQERLWRMARGLTPVRRPGDYAQAIMDLGATVCTRARPACHRCPWQDHCQAHHLGRATDFPVATRRPVRPRRRQLTVLIGNAADQWLFCRRPGRGLLAGLWEPPTFALTAEDPWPLTAMSVAQKLSRHFNRTTTLPVPLDPVEHDFTHFHLTLYPFVCHWHGEGGPDWEGCNHSRWVAPGAWHSLPCATLHRKVLARLAERQG
ncbi:MAG: A/G-specific adenine glycosylase [Magnetococcus sp. DMHC-8]